MFYVFNFILLKYIAASVKKFSRIFEARVKLLEDI